MALGGLLRWCSINNAIIAVFSVYFAWTAFTLFHVFNPHASLVTVDGEGALLDAYEPLWPADAQFTLDVYLSDSARGGSSVVKTGSLLWSEKNLRFGWSNDGTRWKHFNLTSSTMPKALWRRLERNQTVHVHFRLARTDEDRVGVNAELWQSTPLIVFKPHVPRRKKRRLLGHWPIIARLVRPPPVVLNGVAAAAGPDGTFGQDVGEGYWVPQAVVQLVADWTSWPKRSTPGAVLRSLRLDRASGRYLPVVYAQQLGLTAEKLVRVNRTMNSERASAATRAAEAAAERDKVGLHAAAVLNYDSGVLPLDLGVESISVPRWQFRSHMEQTLELQREMGASDRDIDELRHLLTENSPLLLGVTMAVSMLHVLFDCLAFKNDVSFWSSAESMVGLSVRSVVLDLFSQVVIAAYLYEESASLLVLVPAAVGILIQAWKAQRALRIAAHDRSGTASAGVDRKYDTQEIDAAAMRYMGAALAPLVAGFSLYTLLYNEYAGWYSWMIGSLTGSVYAFGFVMMTPQLFINYRLKSVAHLPWRFMCYKALNTFIDDLFAFVIRMPTMHRAACFRDDVIFFVFLYQLYIYPTDFSRPTMEKED